MISSRKKLNSELRILMEALKTSSYKIGVFLLTLISIVVFMGTIMYVVEGGKEGFTSMTQSIYWAIVTVCTVGYGDMIPHTVLGKFISSVAMIIGFAIIAVPIITVEMLKSGIKLRKCPECFHLNDPGANY